MTNLFNFNGGIKSDWLKIGDTKIVIQRVREDDIIFKITSNKVGFETLVKLTNNQMTKIYETINKSYSIRKEVDDTTLSHITAKSKQRIKCENEQIASDKIYQSRECELKMITIGGHMIISLSDQCREYETVSFDAILIKDRLERFVAYIKDIRASLKMSEDLDNM